MIEIWKDIKGYEGIYQISNLGRIKALDRLVTTGKEYPKFQHKPERILRINQCTKYEQVILCKNGKTKAYLVHRLVSQAFIPNPNNFPCVNHKDENPRNNCVDNLEWCTYKYNNEYNGRVDKCKDKISNTLRGRKHTKPLSIEQRQHISNAAKRGWEKRRQRIRERKEN